MADTQTATVAADEFMRVVTNAALSAGTDDTLPTICAIHFRPGTEPGTLMLEATNRYIASQEHVALADLASYDSDWDKTALAAHLADAHGVEPVPGYDMRTAEQVRAEHENKHAELDAAGTPGHDHTVRPVPVTELDCMVSAKDMTKLARTLKLVIEPATRNLMPAERPHVVITFEPGEGGYDGKVSFTLTQNNGTETTVSPKAVFGDFVKMDSLFPNGTPLDGEPAESFSFNPAYLAVFTKIDTGERMTPVTIHPSRMGSRGVAKPVLITIGEHYRALIVPVHGAG
jgi:hypothetical protein